MSGITWWNLGDGTAYGNEGEAGGGLTDTDFNPKPAYQALDQLINHDWKTNLDAKTDSKGLLKFRGFNGNYDTWVVAAGRTKRFNLTIGSNAGRSIRLKMPSSGRQ